VLEGRPQYVEITGNLSAVSKSGEQPYIEFNSFYENRLPLVVRVRDPHHEPTGRVAFFREPRTARSDLPQPPTCSLNVQLPSVDDSATAVTHDAGKIRDDDETESKSSLCYRVIRREKNLRYVFTVGHYRYVERSRCLRVK